MFRSTARTTINALLCAGLFFAPSGIVAAQQAPPPKPKHHSVVKGAAVGAVAGHMTHRKHGAVVGAVVGAEVQHHRNKVAKKNASK